MYRWDELDLPTPKLSGYSYTVDAGLVRTPMDSGYHNQRRRWTNRPTRFNLTFEVSTAELQTVSEVVNEYGYDWLYMPLISGANGMPKPMDHVVRFMSDLTVESGGWDYYNVSAVVEMAEATPSCTLVAYCDDYLTCLTATDVASYTVTVSQQTWDMIADGWGDSTYWGWANV